MVAALLNIESKLFVGLVTDHEIVEAENLPSDPVHEQRRVAATAIVNGIHYFYRRPGDSIVDAPAKDNVDCAMMHQVLRIVAASVTGRDQVSVGCSSDRRNTKCVGVVGPRHKQPLGEQRSDRSGSLLPLWLVFCSGGEAEHEEREKNRESDHGEASEHGTDGMCQEYLIGTYRLELPTILELKVKLALNCKS